MLQADYGLCPIGTLTTTNTLSHAPLFLQPDLAIPKAWCGVWGSLGLPFPCRYVCIVGGGSPNTTRSKARCRTIEISLGLRESCLPIKWTKFTRKWSTRPYFQLWMVFVVSIILFLCVEIVKRVYSPLCLVLICTFIERKNWLHYFKYNILRTFVIRMSVNIWGCGQVTQI